MYIPGKGHYECDGKTYMGSKRKMALAIARRCGFENDTATFTRLIIESRVSRAAMNEQWRIGYNMRQQSTVTNPQPKEAKP